MDIYPIWVYCRYKNDSKEPSQHYYFMNTKYPLVRFPEKTEQIIALLREELKANFFFNNLTKVGLGDCSHQPYLGSIIMELMGFKNCPDELLNFYTSRLEHYTSKIKPEKGNRQLAKKALHLYGDLRQMKKGKK